MAVPRFLQSTNVQIKLKIKSKDKMGGFFPVLQFHILSTWINFSTTFTKSPIHLITKLKQQISSSSLAGKLGVLQEEDEEQILVSKLISKLVSKLISQFRSAN